MKRIPWPALLLLLAGCASQQSAVHHRFGALTMDSVRNVEYAPTILEGRRVGLTEGMFSDPSSRVRVTLTRHVALGDLDGDGFGDAAVVLVTGTGGTGNFRDLAAVVHRRGKAVNVACASLGDRVQVQEVEIGAEGEIAVRLLTHAREDPMCCPSLPAIRTFRLQGDRLAER